MEQRILDILSEILDIENGEITDELSSKDIDEWDSLSSMAIVQQLEKEFDIKFSFAEILEMDNVAAIKKIVQSKI